MDLHRNGAPQKVNINPEDLTFYACDCGCEVFREGVRVGKLSSVHPNNPTGEDIMAKVPVTLCTDCGKQVEIKQ